MSASVVAPGAAPGVRGRQDAAHRGHEVRHERDAHVDAGRELERALHLGRVLVARDPVRADALLGGQRGCAASHAARPAPDSPVLPSTRIGPGSTSPAASSGASPRITGVGKHPGFATSCAPGSCRRTARAGRTPPCRAMPAAGCSNPYQSGYVGAGSRKSPARSITRAPASRSGGASSRARAVREREERDVDGRDVLERVDRSAAERGTGQVRVDLGERLPRGRAAPEERQLDGRMPEQQPYELSAGRARGPQHGDPCRFHHLHSYAEDA